MNKAFRILLVVALAATLLPLTYIPVVAAYSQEIAADEEALWPCSDVLPGAGFAEIDAYDVIPDPQMGALNRHFSGEAGVCYAGSVMEYHVGGGTQMKMRIASNELRHLFVVSPLEISQGGSSNDVLKTAFTLYVPDSLLAQFENLGFFPIAFSQVTDWSYEAMMGASPTDTVAQWIGTINWGFGIGQNQSELVYSLDLNSPDNLDVYFAWRQLPNKLFLPLIINQ